MRVLNVRQIGNATTGAVTSCIVPDYVALYQDYPVWLTPWSPYYSSFCPLRVPVQPPVFLDQNAYFVATLRQPYTLCLFETLLHQTTPSSEAHHCARTYNIATSLAGWSFVKTPCGDTSRRARAARYIVGELPVAQLICIMKTFNVTVVEE